MSVFSVSELTRYIKAVFERDRLLTDVRIQGEISNFKAATSGHFYFTLKDANSSIKGVMFRSASRRITFKPQNGMNVVIKGHVSVYERDGAYQLYAESMEEEGLGSLYQAFEKLKAKLQQAGLFEREHKKELPKMPRRIGLVTSPTGAAVRDMVEILRRRWPGLEVILTPVLVQGAEAPPEIARGIDLQNRYGQADLIIVGRGGGSMEDLWAFNSEEVAWSIYRSAIPVISAVGHETDFTIADFVADVRAATPSAAAELAVPDRMEYRRYLRKAEDRLLRVVTQRFQHSRQRLNYALANRFFTKPEELFFGARQQRVDFLKHRLVASMEKTLGEKQNHLANLAGRLNTVSPLATLSRGYSICFDPTTETIIRDTAQVTPGDPIMIRLNRGSLRSRVEEILNEK